MTLSIIILAAGQGKRMFSETPKVLHLLAGKTLIEHVVHTANTLNTQSTPIIVYGHEGEAVKQALSHLPVNWIFQTQQLGTGHAVFQALTSIPDDHRVLILNADVPLISVDTLKKLIATTPLDAMGIITALFPNPSGLGRIIRDTDGHIIHVIEEKDASETQQAINETNSGIYLVSAALLKKWLPNLESKNAQQEYYLTDIVAMAAAENIFIHSIQPDRYEEVLGVNDRAQLAILERFHQRDLAEKLMLQGVTIYDPNRLDIRGELSVGNETVIDVNVIFEGTVHIGNNCIIGPNTILRNVTLGDRVEIKANSMLDGAEIADDCIVGPFARLRPGSVLKAKCHIGNFVEIKNSNVGIGSKISHLTYIGDADIGNQVNIGAGTITCNYDGANKHRTTIGDNVFIGSNTALVAPIIVGENATIGAGSTLSRDAPPGKLTLTRAQQLTVENWQRPKKKES